MQTKGAPLLPRMVLGTALGRGSVRTLGWGRAEAVARLCLPFLRPSDRVLDIGSGTGQVARRMRHRVSSVRTCDVADLGCYPDTPPLLFDGRRLPYADASFDVALLLFVLHHAVDPRSLLAEASRLAARVVVFEDLHISPGNDRRRGLIDAVLNGARGSASPGPRREAEWLPLFAHRGLTLLCARGTSLFPCFHQAIYLLDADFGRSVDLRPH